LSVKQVEIKRATKGERVSTNILCWLHDALILKIKAVTGALRKNLEPQTAYLNVRLTEQPTDGRANEQLRRLLSKTFAVGTSSMRIEKAINTRRRICRVHKPKKLPDFISP